MNRRVLLSPVALAALLLSPTAAAPAQELPENVFAPAPGDEIQDVVFLADARPLFLRFHIRVEGTAFRAAWADFAGRLHRFLDSDGDGTLTLQEAQRGNWQQSLLNPIGNRQAVAPGAGTAQAGLDSSPKDGKVSRDELAAYLRSALGFGEFGLQPGPPVDPRTQALFGHLDLDRDGKLSSAELAAADAFVARLDLDEDELIGLDELKPFENAYADRFRPVAINGMLSGSAEGDNPAFVAFGPGAVAPRLVQRLVGKYDRGTPGAPKDGRLSLTELGCSAEAFRRHDANGDGGLDAAELTALLGRPAPDLELDVALGSGGKPGSKLAPVGAPRVAVSVVPKPTARAASGPGPLRLDLEGTLVELSIEDNINSNRNIYNQQFDNADSDKNGYVDQAEARRNGALQQVFQAADRDGDGKLFKKELDAYLDRQSEAISSRTMLTIHDRGRSLLEILDADGDQKLGLRELRQSAERLSALDRDGDGRIARGEIPQSYRLGIGRGRALIRRGFTIEPYDSADPPGRKAGPPWFEKMDRNRDGDVSFREFLGARSDFRRLDTDGDGLIDPQEAGEKK